MMIIEVILLVLMLKKKKTRKKMKTKILPNLFKLLKNLKEKSKKKYDINKKLNNLTIFI